MVFLGPLTEHFHGTLKMFTHKTLGKGQENLVKQ